MAGVDTLSKKAQELVARSLEPDEEVLVAINGESAGLVATSRRILVCKWGSASGSFFSKQINSWDLSNVTGIEHRTGMTTESIVVQSAGTVPVTKFGRLHHGTGSVWEAPNALFVSKKGDAEHTVAALRRLVADHQGAGSGTGRAQSGRVEDPVEQVRRLGQLRDEGLLTEDEFQTKKRSILGL